MNKYLMLSAAALFGSALPAFAGDQARMHTIHFETANGASYCDGMSFQKTGRHIAAGLHLKDNCASNVQVVGTVDKKAFQLSQNYNSGHSIALMYDIFKPIRNGGTWDLWICFSGTSCFEGNSGVYKLGFPASGGSRMATTARVVGMIAERKAARAREAK